MKRGLQPNPPPNARGGRRGGSALLALLAGIVCAAALLAGSRLAGGGAEEETAPFPRVLVPTGPPEVVSADTLSSRRTLGQILAAHGYAGSEHRTLLNLVREVESPRRLQPGTTVRFSASVPMRTNRISLRLDRDRTLHLASTGAAGWESRLDSISVEQDTLRVGGIIERSLATARLTGDTAKLVENEDLEIVYELARIYAWQIDFFREIRPGDAFRVLIERDVRPDGSVRSARVLAAEFRNRGRRLPAIRFVAPDEPPEYFDEEGEATRKAFLRAPLEFGRMTSGFTRRRYHPVLRRNRAHLGIDYGARRGTEVLATGGGVVTRAEWWGGYGRMVEIRHSNSRYRTRYAHLSRIAGGIRPGARVNQSQVIGYVGSTGLSTAPHLHYEFLVDGSQRDPRRVDLPPGDPVGDEHRAAFLERQEERMALLAELPLEVWDPEADGVPAAASTQVLVED